jgi:hypothetical protein
MARILRGDIRWANLNPTRGHEQAGHRPVLMETYLPQHGGCYSKMWIWPV